MAQPTPTACCCSVTGRAAPVASASPRGLAVVVLLAGGLLSSSCCVVQLAMNALSMGCAGFAVLKPWKPYMRAWTLALVVRTLLQSGSNRRSLFLVTLTLALTYSEDLLAWHNRKGVGWGSLGAAQQPPKKPVPEPVSGPTTGAVRMLEQQQCSGSSCPDVGAAAAAVPQCADGHEAHALEGGQRQAYMRFAVQQIKCEGCAAKLRASILHVPGVQRCTVDYGAGSVLVWGSGDLDALDVQAAIRVADFSYRVQLLEHSRLA